MRILRLVSAGTAVLIIGGCADGRTVLDPSAPSASLAGRSPQSAATPARRIATSGTFDAMVDFSTLTLTPRGSNCRLEVDGRLVFSGTIEGVAIGHTSALVKAPCSAVAAAPPGTYPDVFKSEATFEGTVGGIPARSNLLYMGRSQPGGHIDGRFVFSRGVEGRLEVSSQIAVGGTYHGSVVVN